MFNLHHSLLSERDVVLRLGILFYTCANIETLNSSTLSASMISLHCYLITHCIHIHIYFKRVSKALTTYICTSKVCRWIPATLPIPSSGCRWQHAPPLTSDDNEMTMMYINDDAFFENWMLATYLPKQVVKSFRCPVVRSSRSSNIQIMYRRIMQSSN